MKSVHDKFTRILRTKGAGELLRALGRKIYYPHPSRSYLQKLSRKADKISIVQIGAHIGNTGNDPLYAFLKQHCERGHSPQRVRVTAVLVEPVASLFCQLQKNYVDFEGVTCKNVAIAETSGVRPFYRLRSDIDLSALQLPDWLNQLGSLKVERIRDYWVAGEQDAACKRFVEENTVVDQVTCITFEELLIRSGLKHVDVLQMDVEGYEYEILKTINFSVVKPQYINYERELLGAEEAQCSEMLRRAGYEVYTYGENALALLPPTQGGVASWRRSLMRHWLKIVDPASVPQPS